MSEITLHFRQDDTTLCTVCGCDLNRPADHWWLSNSWTRDTGNKQARRARQNVRRIDYKERASMSSEMKEIVVVVACFAVIIVSIIVGTLWFKSERCSAQWSSSGMAHSWGLVKGCMVQRKDGTWIPASAYREVAE